MTRTGDYSRIPGGVKLSKTYYSRILRLDALCLLLQRNDCNQQLYSKRFTEIKSSLQDVWRTFMYVEPVSDAMSSSMIVVPTVLPQRSASTCVYLATCREQCMYDV